MMKFIMKQVLYIVIIIVFCFSCNGNSKTHQKTKGLKKIIVKDSVPNKQKNNREKDIRYVDSESGLNYREAPNGEIINKFPYNTSLNIVQVTGVYQEVKDEDEVLNGEWLGVIKEKDTVYVFSKFLSNAKDVSNLPEENEYFIEDVETLSKTDKYVREHLNDSVIVRQIPIKKFISIKKISKNKYKRIFDKYSNIQKEKDVIKTDSVIKIECLNNKKLIYKDNYPKYDEEIETHHYLGTFEGINSYLICKKGYESSSFLIINKGSCEYTEYNGYPVFNTDYSKMITIDTDSFEYSEFGVYKLVNNKYKLTNTFILDIEVNDFIFVNNKSLYLEYGVEWNDGEMQKKSNQYFRIDFDTE